MPQRTDYPHGMPSWVDISSSDLDATKAFYCRLFGWETIDAGPPEETGGYGMFTKGGKLVAGFGPHSQEALDQGDVPAWTTYLSVDDADRTAKLVEEHDGTVVVPPMDVMTAGRMAFVADPTGCRVGLWQPGEHRGAELLNEHGALCWNELLSTDPATSVAFLQGVFGYEAVELGVGDFDYTALRVGEELVAGVQAIQEPLPMGWSTVFAVDGCDATTELAAQLGASVLSEPRDIEPGRVAALADPHGVTFQVIQLAGQ